jgi:hypothetical protein
MRLLFPHCIEQRTETLEAVYLQCTRFPTIRNYRAMIPIQGAAANLGAAKKVTGVPPNLELLPFYCLFCFTA